jgi:hypothetical protein
MIGKNVKGLFHGKSFTGMIDSIEVSARNSDILLAHIIFDKPVIVSGHSMLAITLKLSSEEKFTPEFNYPSDFLSIVN